jgi:ABC-2 type transport system permease protein
MITICSQEFKSLFKSVRSVIIIILLLGVTLGTATLLGKFEAEIQEVGLGGIYVAGLFALLMISGPLFVIGLSHDVINKETHSRTMRFLVTKATRQSIVLGKFMGIWLFWLTCLIIPILLLIPFAKTFYYMELISLVIFMSYFIALALFLSCLINKPALTLFIGIVLSIIFPIIGFWGILSPENNYLNVINFIAPYYYLTEDSGILGYIMLPLFTLLLVVGSLFILKRRDL